MGEKVEFKIYRVSGKLDDMMLDMVKSIANIKTNDIITVSDGDFGDHLFTSFNPVTGEVIVERPNWIPGMGYVKEELFEIGKPYDVNLNDFGFNFIIEKIEFVSVDEAGNQEGIQPLYNFIKTEVNGFKK